MTVLTATIDPALRTDACGAGPSWLCRSVLDLTGSATTARLADVLVRPLKIIFVLVVALVVLRLLRRSLTRFTTRLSTGPMAGLRAAARAKTISDVLGSVIAAVVGVVALLTVLGELGINLGPLLAGAGFAGVAFGFGAQSLVKDFLSGLFMLIEDQYGVGDAIDVGSASGVVEAVTLRTTVLRDLDGVVWHVPNGEIRRVGNKSQQWGRTVVDVDVAYEADLDQAQVVIKAVADEVWHDAAWSARILEEPAMWGVERLGGDLATLRLAVRTVPGEQANVAREVRRRVKPALQAAGVPTPVNRPLLPPS